MKSCTRFINASLIPANIFSAGTKLADKQIYICDSAGFGDKAGI